MALKHEEQLTESHGSVSIAVPFAENVIEVLGHEAAFWVVCAAVGAVLY